MKKSDYLLVGLVEKIVGLKGEIIIRPADNDKSRFSKLNRVSFFDRNEAHLADATVRDVNLKGKNPRIRLNEFTDRTSAERLKDLEMYVKWDDRKQTGKNEFFHFELEGCEVLTEDGFRVGEVSAVHNYPSCDALLVRDREKKNSVLIPMLKNIIKGTEPENKKIFIYEGSLEGLI
ncbi:MAG: ribosome maturation factor RimM [Fibrobacterota bacterium]